MEPSAYCRLTPAVIVQMGNGPDKEKKKKSQKGEKPFEVADKVFPGHSKRGAEEHGNIRGNRGERWAARDMDGMKKVQTVHFVDWNKNIALSRPVKILV